MSQTSAPETAPNQHDEEPHGDQGSRLNWLRAGVLGANDGIVSVAGILVGVAGATTDTHALLVAGVAGLSAGALSMAAGEYVSVSTQRDTERALIEKEVRELREGPEEELAELAGLYQAKGLTPELAHEVARQLTEHDALAAHAEAELGIDPENYTNPWEAAFASMVSFTIGGLIPFLAMLLTPAGGRLWATLVAVVLALVVTGFVSARLGGARSLPAVLRNVFGGLFAMAVTYLIGRAVGARVR